MASIDELPPRSLRAQVMASDYPADEVHGSSPKRRPRCTQCGSGGTRSVRFDAYYCVSCNEWLEDRCSDPSCNFCTARPFNP